MVTGEPFYDVVFDHVCCLLSTKVHLEVDNLLLKYPEELIDELLNMPDSVLKGQMLLQYIEINDLKIVDTTDLKQLLKYYLDLLFHFSDNYNINPYLLAQEYITNKDKTHVMTHMLAEKICHNIINLDK